MADGIERDNERSDLTAGRMNVMTLPERRVGDIRPPPNSAVRHGLHQAVLHRHTPAPRSAPARAEDWPGDRHHAAVAEASRDPRRSMMSLSSCVAAGGLLFARTITV